MSRKQRSDHAKPLKNLINSISHHLPIFQIAMPLSGTNESRQYNAEIHYHSKASDNIGRIFIEIALREAHLTTPIQALVNTLLTHPFNHQNTVKPFLVRCFSMEEAYAEKIRAALTRRQPAIRDFYDIDYALRNKMINPYNETFIELVKKKLLADPKQPVTINHDTKALLRNKITAELIPTLKPSEKEIFNLDKVFEFVETYHTSCLSDLVF